MSLRLEIGMGFKALHKGSNTKSRVVKMYQLWKLGFLDIIIEWKSIHYFVHHLAISLSTTAKSNTHINHGIPRNQNPLIPSGKHKRFAPTDLFG